VRAVSIRVRQAQDLPGEEGAEDRLEPQMGVPTIRASTALRPIASPVRRARGPRKWRTSISRPLRKSRNASPIVDSSRTAWSGVTRSSTAGPSTIPATISSTGPGTGTLGTAARINGTAAATASTATRLSRFIVTIRRSQSGKAPRYSCKAACLRHRSAGASGPVGRASGPAAGEPHAWGSRTRSAGSLVIAW
jgi:hypothetical protein